MPDRRGRLQVAAVRERLAERRGEPPVADRERAREARSRRGGSSRRSSPCTWCAAAPWRSRPCGRRRTRCGCRSTTGSPAIGFAGAVEVEHAHRVAVQVGVRVRRHAVVTEAQAVTAAEHAEVVVVGVVLLHVDDDVLDLRQEVDALGLRRVRTGARRADQTRASAPSTARDAARPSERRRGHHSRRAPQLPGGLGGRAGGSARGGGRARRAPRTPLVAERRRG